MKFINPQCTGTHLKNGENHKTKLFNKKERWKKKIFQDYQSGEKTALLSAATRASRSDAW